MAGTALIAAFCSVLVEKPPTAGRMIGMVEDPGLAGMQPELLIHEALIGGGPGSKRLSIGPPAAILLAVPVPIARAGPVGVPLPAVRPRSNLLPRWRILEDMDVPIDLALDARTDVPAAARGDRDAFERLYRAHAAGLYPALWRLAGGDRTRAEDWLQDAFIQAWSRLDQLKDPAAFPAWIQRLAVNVALSDRRRSGFRVASEAPDRAAPEPPWPGADLDLERAIAMLPDRARQVFVLFHLCDLGHAEIAERMAVEIGTTKAQLHRARTILKEKLA